MARLAGIEWGGDIHVPHGNLKRAAEVRRMTEGAGLVVASYGSYYTVGKSEEEGLDFKRVLDTAVALGAPLIRVWAGDKASSDANDADRRRVVAESWRIAGEAGKAGVSLAYEFHGGTLMDTTASAVALMDATAAAGMRCYWQPPIECSQADRSASLLAVLSHLGNLHVFYWKNAGDRRPLTEGYREWLIFLSDAAAAAPSRRETCWALLEFVRGDDPRQLFADAEVLKRLLRQVGMPPGSSV